MKIFLCGVGAFLICLSAHAQTADGLFPELRKKAPASNAAVSSTVSDEQGRVVPLPANSETSLFKGGVNIADPATIEKEEVVVDNRENLTKNLSEAAQNQKDKEKALSGSFTIYPHNLQIVIPIVQHMQFCTGKISLENGTEHELFGMKGVITYGSIGVPFSFGRTKSGEKNTATVSLAGTICQDLMRPASLNIEICRADNMPEDECKQKAKYILK